MSNQTHASSTIFVIFGATGDVVAKKIVPALYRLFQRGQLPNLFQVVGYSRRELSDQDFREHVRGLIHDHIGDTSKDELERFLKLFTYTQGQMDEAADYLRLGKVLGRIDGEWKTCANKLFYLAVPPDLYEPILRNLSKAGLTTDCGEQGIWTRILVEKPIGSDEKTSEKINMLLGDLLQESQIYRIEHYLAKEMVRNILTFRFRNDLFEKNWGASSIESIHIRLWETLGVEKRGNFYDQVGALRDVGQNHVLQMLALLTMDQPEDFSPEHVREQREIVLRALRLDGDNLAESTYRAQYAGYQTIAGVAPDSKTETYFKLRARLDTSRWEDVPIWLEAGKRLGEIKKEAVITFRHPAKCFCPPNVLEHLKNKIIISLEPQEGIKIEFLSKRPGTTMDVETRTFDFSLRDASERHQYVEEYEKVIFDAIMGDQTLFVGTKELRAMWGFIDPILEGWSADKVPLRVYAPDTNQATEEAMILEK